MKTIFEKEGLQIVLEESPVHEGQFYVKTTIGEKTVSYECYMNEMEAFRNFYIEIVNCTGNSKYIYNK